MLGVGGGAIARIDDRRLGTAATTRVIGLSFNRRQLFQIDAFDPFLQFLWILVLQFDLKEITVGDHDPQRGVFAFLFERLKTGIAFNRDRFAVTFSGLAVVVPGSGGGAYVIRIRH